MRVLVLGGYGVFGGRLAQLLLSRGHDVLIAGRRLAEAERFSAKHGGQPAAIPDQPPFWHGSDVVVDAAGPFQAYGGFERARSVLAEGAHYLDLSDDAAFVAGITALQTQASDAGLAALSGASTVPAISAAAVRDLSEGLTEVSAISSAIVPGNRAPRGRAVMAGILAQVGRPMPVWRGGRWTEDSAWTAADSISLPSLGERSVSPIGAPDLLLFPERFGARSVHFQAGLELSVMHRGLWALAWAVRLGLIRRLELATDAMRWCAGLMQGLGTDKGGMIVEVSGRDATGRPVRRRWWLFAEGGRGPMVPAVPAAALVSKLAKSEVAPGARPCLDDLTLDEVETALSAVPIATGRDEAAAPRLFEAAIADDWPTLPQKVRALHDLWDEAVYEGRAEIDRGSGVFSRLVGAFFRFPPAASDVSVRVEMRRKGGRETWTRRFGEHRFRSVLSAAGPGHVHERFGLFRFRLALPVENGSLGMPVVAGDILGLPIPKSLLPISETREYVEDGRFRFDVRLSVPLAGFVVHYRGWLEPVRGAPDQPPK